MRSHPRGLELTLLSETFRNLSSKCLLRISCRLKTYVHILLRLYQRHSKCTYSLFAFQILNDSDWFHLQLHVILISIFFFHYVACTKAVSAVFKYLQCFFCCFFLNITIFSFLLQFIHCLYFPCLNRNKKLDLHRWTKHLAEGAWGGRKRSLT